MNIKKSIIILFITAAAFSCTMKQEVFLEKSGEGQVSFEIGMASYLGEVIDQFEMLLEPDAQESKEDESFFDLAEIEKGLSENKSISNIKLETADKHNLKGSFRFSSVEDMMNEIKEDSAEKRLINFEKGASRSTLTVNINRDTIVAMLEENPALNNPLVENFGPASTEGLSRTDYLDMMEFALGEESRMGIQNSSLSMDIRVAGSILEQKGGQQLDSSTVRFEIPLLDILILDQDLIYTLSYK